MDIPALKRLLLWCAAINYAILLVWFGVFVSCHDWLFGMHSRWFTLSVQTFDTLNYLGIAIYKIGIMLFVLVPLLALHFSTRKA